MHRKQRPALAGQGISRGILLPATTVSTGAAVAAWNHHLVPEFPGHAKTPALQYPVQDQGSADAGAQVHAHHVVLTRGGAKPVFGPACGIGVIAQQHVPAQGSLKVRAQRFIAPGKVRGKGHGAAGWIHPPRRTDADHRLGAARAKFCDKFAHRREYRRRVCPNRGAPAPDQDVPAGVNQSRGDLGAANVYADRVAFHASPRTPEMPPSLRPTRMFAASAGSSTRKINSAMRRSRASSFNNW